MNYIQSGKSEGAKVVCGGNRVDRKGYFIESTVFTGVDENMKICKEEIFGPVMSIIKFKTVDEVIERANNNDYGLVSGVLTNSLETALEVSNALRSGIVFVNSWASLNTTTPIGGFKNSGIGRELGKSCLDNYLELKTVIMKRPDKSLP